MIRSLHSELLDDLPANDSGAIQSRRDLRLLNTLMGHTGILTRSLKKIFPARPPSRILEIGAGEGELLLRVARRMTPSRRIKSQNNRNPESATKFPPLPRGEGRGEGEGDAINPHVSNRQLHSTPPPVEVLFIDLQNLLRAETKAAFAALNWNVRSIEADIFQWLADTTAEKTDVIIANLVLHHFSDAQLSTLFSTAAQTCDAFIAIEPRRSGWPLFWTRRLSLIGCSPVTCHDAPVSVLAGFTGSELSTLWPSDGGWKLTERRAGLFSHLFVAQRKS
jgi:hypothetical protein